MMSVGYDMYLKLLNDAVLEQQGKTPPTRLDCSADLTVSAYIPERDTPQAGAEDGSVPAHRRCGRRRTRAS